MGRGLVRAETDGNVLDGLRWGRDEFPLQYCRGRAFSQDGVTPDNVHVAHLSIGQHRRFQTNQTSDLCML